MKKYLLILTALLAGLMCYAVMGGRSPKKDPTPKEERREQREQRRAERLEKYEKFMDSLVLSRNFQFNPQTMQQQPAFGTIRSISACPISRDTCRPITSRC